MYTVYVIYSKKLNKFYTGQTLDFSIRIEEHNRGKTPFMAKGRPWSLVYSKNVTSRADAMKLETQIKKRDAKRYLQDLGIIG